MILVEGHSDRAAVLAAARLRGRDLDIEGVRVVAMGGITNLGHHLDAAALTGPIAGLYDAPERPYVERVLRRVTGIDGPVDPARFGFHGCVVDLEDELIRALGVPAVERVIDEAGEGRRWRTMRGQPAQRDRTDRERLLRFIGGRSGAKERYARLFVESLDPAALPAPLVAVLDLG